MSKVFSNEAACSGKIESSALEMKIKILESKIRFQENLNMFSVKKNFTNYIKERLRVVWLKKVRLVLAWGKSSKFLLNFDKNCAAQNQIRTISCSEKEIIRNNWWKRNKYWTV